MMACVFKRALVLAFALLTAPLLADNSTVTLRRCVNFMASYSGCWLAHSKLFQKTKWVDKEALEFATRDMVGLD
jgi:hypothetical protein